MSWVSRGSSVDADPCPDSVDRPFPCVFCSQSFARRDVLVRHLKTCKAKAGPGVLETVPPRRRGRKRNSCDACARLKRACSGTQPCLSCVHRKQSCYFPASSSKRDNQLSKDARLDGVEESSSGEDWENFLLPSLSQVNSIDEAAYQESGNVGNDPGSYTAPPPQLVHPAVIPQDQGYEHLFDVSSQAVSTSGFLANFTNTKGIANSFECGTLEQRTSIMQILLSQLPSGEPHLDDGALSITTRHCERAQRSS